MESFARLFVVCLDCAFVVFCFIVSLEVSLIDGLNVQQEEAVLYFDGPCMVVAGPGSGKTKVLTTKIAYLILCKNKAPRRIMALTFTNKAAAEMKSRLALLGVDTNGLMVGTFHSCFTKILRLESSYIDYGSNFSILDATDDKSVISDVVRKLSFPKWLNGSLGGNSKYAQKYAANSYQYIQQQWNFYRNQAYAEAMMPTADDMRVIKNEWNRLVPEFESDDTFFRNNNKRELIYNDYYNGY